jgi:carbamate kinase
MRVVAALGGNAQLERGELPEARVQEEHVHKAALALAPLAQAHQLVLTHGNGPQVGLLALANAHAPGLRTPYPTSPPSRRGSAPPRPARCAG